MSEEKTVIFCIIRIVLSFYYFVALLSCTEIQIMAEKLETRDGSWCSQLLEYQLKEVVVPIDMHLEVQRKN